VKSQTAGVKTLNKAPAMRRTVYVTEGTIEGVEQDGIFIFKGIPFAAPVGDLRWKSLQAHMRLNRKSILHTLQPVSINWIRLLTIKIQTHDLNQAIMRLHISCS
jgi:carboxylesterase type B